MDTLQKYYVHTRLTSAGRLKHREISEAKAFLIEQFPVLDCSMTDSLIQQILVKLMKAGSHLAQVCLRCYISNASQLACLDLIQKYNLQKHNLSEIRAYVLDDVRPMQSFDTDTLYVPFAFKVIQTFDPNQSSLSYWTKRLVSQHPEVNRLLKERGIYVASDWAILNQTSAAQVKRLLSAMLTDAELQRATALLASFHHVYRADRLQQEAAIGGKRCPDPSEVQIQRMIAFLDAENPATATQLLRELRVLAAQLRRAKRPNITSLEQAGCLASLAQPLLSSEEIFLSKYHRLSEICLLKAIQAVLQQRFTQLQSRSSEQAAQFQKALSLFFVEGKSMGKIAALIGLKQQFEVTRLLKLKQMRAAVSDQYVALLEPQLRQLLSADFPPDTLAQLNLQPLLVEMSQQMMAEDVTECYSAHRKAKNSVNQSLFSLCICRVLQFCA